jgi:hypothetical protein
MSNYVSLITKEYANGRMCITTDRLSGILTSHGFSSKVLWRKILEWTSQKNNLENINMAILNNYNVASNGYLDNFKPIYYKNIDLQDVCTNNISNFDLIYCIGLPSLVSNDASSAIERYIRNGGGILIEVPNIEKEYINIIRDISLIYCSSLNRPIYDYSYWTTVGKDHYVYSSKAIVNFYSTILFDLVPSDWSILMTDTPSVSSQISNITMTGSASASLSISYSNVFKNGIVSFDKEE